MLKFFADTFEQVIGVFLIIIVAAFGVIGGALGHFYGDDIIITAITAVFGLIIGFFASVLIGGPVSVFLEIRDDLRYLQKMKSNEGQQQTNPS